MRTDELYLTDILGSARKIRMFISDVTETAFHQDTMIQDAVLMNLIIIGEAANRISERTRTLTPDIPWKDIAGFRHVAVHSYFSLDLDQIWEIANKNVAELNARVEAFMEKYFNDSYKQYMDNFE